MTLLMIAGLDTTDHFTEQTIPMNKHSGEEKQPLSRKKAFSFIPFCLLFVFDLTFCFPESPKRKSSPQNQKYTFVLIPAMLFVHLPSLKYNGTALQFAWVLKV